MLFASELPQKNLIAVSLGGLDDLDSVKFVLSKYPQLLNEKTGGNQVTLLMQAVGAGAINVVSWLMKQPNIKLDIKDYEHKTAIDYISATVSGYPEKDARTQKFLKGLLTGQVYI